MPSIISIFNQYGAISPPVELEKMMWKLSEQEIPNNHRFKKLFIECNSVDEKQLWEIDVVFKDLSESRGGPRVVRRVLTVWDNKTFVTLIGFGNRENMKLEIDVKVKNLLPTSIGCDRKVEPNVIDAVLKIGDKEISVCKKILAQSSKYFYDLFYETNIGQEIFQIDDVNYNEFVVFLAFLYGSTMPVSHESLEVLTSLSKQFKADYCLDRCEKILVKFGNLTAEEKLRRAQGYEFNVLHDYVLKKLGKMEEVMDLENGSEKFGTVTNLKMFERIGEIHRKQPYCEQIVNFPNNKQEQIIHIGAMPCKIKRTARRNEYECPVSIHCNWQDTTNPWECALIIVPSGISSAETLTYIRDTKCAFNTYRFDWLNPTQNVPDLQPSSRFVITYFVGMLPERSIDFSLPRENLTDIVLVVDDRKFNVSKQILAENSTVFYAMFYGDFVEKNKKEIPLKDVDPIEFEELLQHIYYPDRNVTDKTINGLLKLSQMYNFPQILSKCEKVLIFENTLTDAMKMYLAETYQFLDLFKSLKSKIKTFDDLKALYTMDGFKELSKDTIADITVALLESACSASTDNGQNGYNH